MIKCKDLDSIKKQSLNLLRDACFSIVAFLFHLELFDLGCDFNLSQFKELNGILALVLGFYSLLCLSVGFVSYVVYDVKRKKEIKLDEKK